MNADTRKADGPYDILFLTAGFLLLLIFGLRTVSGSDIWMHLAAGRHAAAAGAAMTDPFSFGIQPGSPWRQVTWLYDLMVYKMWILGGSSLVILAHAVSVIGAFLALLPACRNQSRQIHTAGALLLSAWIMAPLFNLRPMVFCLVFLAASMTLLSRPRLGLPGMVVLGLIQVLWANMHLTFILGIAMAAARTLEAFLLRRKNPDVETLRQTGPAVYGGFTVGLAALSCLTPFGPKLFADALSIFTKSDRHIMLEWISIFHRDFLSLPTGFLTTVALTLIAAVFIFYRGRLSAVPTFAAIVAAFLMVRSNLTLELCAVLSFPFFTLGIATLERLSDKLPSDASRRLLGRAAGIALALLLAFSAWNVMTNRYYVNSGSASAFGLGVNTDIIPAGAVSAIAEKHEFPARMLNIAHDGGYLVWRRPQSRVFSDPRGSLYGGVFFQRLAKGLLGNPTHWKDLITRYDPEGVLLNATWTGSGTVVYHLLAQGQWSMAYFDGTTVLLVRKTSSNRALMEDKEMQKKGLELLDAAMERYRSNVDNAIIRPPNPSRLIGASAVLQALGRYEESLRIFELLNKGTPRMVTAWVNRGIAEINTGRNKDAIRSLERSLDLLGANPIALLWLSEAYAQDGRASDAATALERARKINPELVALFKKERESLMFQPPPP